MYHCLTFFECISSPQTNTSPPALCICLALEVCFYQPIPTVQEPQSSPHKQLLCGQPMGSCSHYIACASISEAEHRMWSSHLLRAVLSICIGDTGRSISLLPRDIWQLLRAVQLKTLASGSSLSRLQDFPGQHADLASSSLTHPAGPEAFLRPSSAFVSTLGATTALFPLGLVFVIFWPLQSVSAIHADGILFCWTQELCGTWSRLQHAALRPCGQLRVRTKTPMRGTYGSV